MSPSESPLPKLSIRLHGGMHPRDCLAFAKTADEAGLQGVWFAENPFARGILAAATLCAAHTRNIHIGAGVFNPFSRHPSLMAMEIGALDEVSDGRVSLSIGAGVAGGVERMGFSYDKPLSAVRDAVAIVRGLLKGETVTYEGKVLSSKGIKLDYVARPGLPIHVAGRGDNTLAFCGEAADGWIVSNMCTPGFIAEASQIVFGAARKAGRTVLPEIVRYAPCVVRKDRAEAHLAAKLAVAEMLPGFVALSKRVATVKDALLIGTGLEESELDTAAARLKAGEDAGAVLDERHVAAYAVAGTPEDCLEQAASQKALGITDLALTFAGEMPHEEMRLLAGATR
ncbi:LLM class flavin-dependent oxidoreductase [Aquabacter sp. CN5-332]|uniref:LLM class flavin-dependent oxidoreductase n=1 Tax=Aquabacter sp. CN5-332 TaxID=3156608 RepID=UPI0032B50313